MPFLPHAALRLPFQKRKKYLRRVLLAVLVFLVAMAQNVPWLPGIFNCRALPLLPLAVCIAVLDQEVPGVLFGALAGALWDFSCAGVSWNGIYLTTVAFASAMLMRYVLNRNKLTISLLCFLSSAFYLALRWLLDSALPYWQNRAEPFNPYLPPLPLLLRYTLPSLAYTLLLAPLCYSLANAIVKRTSRKTRKVLQKS